MALLTFRQLEIFAQAVEHGSFRRCAEHIGISQVAVSEQVRQLEARLEHRLFARRPGAAAQLTREGEEVYQRVKNILADVDGLVMDFGQARRDGVRRITVGTQAYIMQYFQHLIPDLEAAHAPLSIQPDFSAFTADAVNERLRAHDLDLAYFLCVETPEVPDSRLVAEEPMALFAGEGHPLLNLSKVTAADLEAMPVMHLAPDNPLRGLTEQCLTRAGIGEIPVSLETDNFGLLLTSARRNMGLLCTFQSLEQLVAETSKLKRVPLDPPLPAMQIRLAVRKAVRHDPLIRQVSDRLSRAFATQP